MRAYLTAGLVFVAGAAQTGGSLAHSLPCAHRQVLANDLLRVYAESPRAIGLSGDGTVLELLSSPGGSSWTLMVTRADGLSCLLASGDSLEFLPAASAPESGTKGEDG